MEIEKKVNDSIGETLLSILEQLRTAVRNEDLEQIKILKELYLEIQPKATWYFPSREQIIL
jgi:hypothetical protein